MTVADLRRLLVDYPDDALVVLARDSEGNGYSPLVGAWSAHYAADCSFFGTAYTTQDALECKVDLSKTVLALVLTPTS